MSRPTWMHGMGARLSPRVRLEPDKRVDTEAEAKRLRLPAGDAGGPLVGWPGPISCAAPRTTGSRVLIGRGGLAPEHLRQFLVAEDHFHPGSRISRFKRHGASPRLAWPPPASSSAQ